MAWSSAAAGLVAVVLVALTFGVPEQAGCGGPVETRAVVAAGGGAVANTPDAGLAAAPASGADAGTSSETLSGVLDGSPTSRLAGPPKVFLVWDLPGSSGSAYKLGEGVTTSGGFSLAMPSAPPDEVLAGGSVAVAHLVAVAQSAQVADGLLSSDDSDALAQGAFGASGSYAVVYKAGEDARYDWLAAFPKGISCAQGQAPAPGARLSGDAPLAGFARVRCSELHLAFGPIESAPFTNWSLPALVAHAQPAAH